MLNIPDLLAKKRDGGVLSSTELADLVAAIANQQLQESQVGAFLMACYIRGLNGDETTALTKEMIANGDSFSWPAEWKGKVVDKHSTGGVGDTVSLPLALLLAALGFRVPMLSGRGLGHTGGTCDKLESIPGFRVDLSMDEIYTAVREVGCCITATTSTIVPVDKILYAARDVTSTVSSAELIAASIVSKKCAEHLDHLVLTCTYGRAGWYHLEEGRAFGKMMSELAGSLGTSCTVLMMRMDEPLGHWVGNSAEVVEAVEYLRGDNRASDLHEVITQCASALLTASDTSHSFKEAAKMVETALSSGAALQKFEEMCVAQGVERATASRLCSGDFSMLPRHDVIHSFRASQSGFIKSMDALEIGYVMRELGAGRMTAGSQLDLGVSFQIVHNVGSRVDKGEIDATLAAMNKCTSASHLLLTHSLYKLCFWPYLRLTVLHVLLFPNAVCRPKQATYFADRSVTDCLLFLRLSWETS